MQCANGVVGPAEAVSRARCLGFTHARIGQGRESSHAKCNLFSEIYPQKILLLLHPNRFIQVEVYPCSRFLQTT